MRNTWLFCLFISCGRTLPLPAFLLESWSSDEQWWDLHMQGNPTIEDIVYFDGWARRWAEENASKVASSNNAAARLVAV
jgi:hypothetical protein